ncbi:hypothetical protein SALBM135S_06598 [Streptomyces alboniger]
MHGERRVVGDAVRGERLPVALQAVPGGGALLRARDVADAAVAEADQVLGDPPAAAAVVEGERHGVGVGGGRPAAEHHP